MVEEKSQIGTDVVKFFEHEKLIRKAAKMEFLNYIEKTGKIPSKRKWIAMQLKKAIDDGHQLTYGDFEDLLYDCSMMGCTGDGIQDSKPLSKPLKEILIAKINEFLQEEDK